MEVTFNYRKWAEDNEVYVHSYDVHSDLSVTVYDGYDGHENYIPPSRAISYLTYKPKKREHDKWGTQEKVELMNEFHRWISNQAEFHQRSESNIIRKLKNIIAYLQK